METEQSIDLECAVCNKKTGVKRGEKTYVLGAFGFDEDKASHFCSMECFERFFGMDEDEFDDEDLEDEE